MMEFLDHVIPKFDKQITLAQEKTSHRNNRQKQNRGEQSLGRELEALST